MPKNRTNLARQIITGGGGGGGEIIKKKGGKISLVKKKDRGK